MANHASGAAACERRDRRCLLSDLLRRGLPALIYQVTWQRVLTLYFGVDIYSTTVTVSTFMLGLGVGSLLGGWIADRVARPAAVLRRLSKSSWAASVREPLDVLVDRPAASLEARRPT